MADAATPNKTLIGMLIAAIAVMTLAIAFLGGMMLGRMLAPAGGGTDRAYAFEDFSERMLDLPEGARIIASQPGDGAVLLTVETADGARYVASVALPPGAKIKVSE